MIRNSLGANFTNYVCAANHGLEILNILLLGLLDFSCSSMVSQLIYTVLNYLLSPVIAEKPPRAGLVEWKTNQQNHGTSRGGQTD